MRYAIVDDDPYTQEALSEIIRDRDPDAIIQVTNGLAPVADVAIFATCDYKPICDYLARCPGCTIILNSCISHNALMDVAADIRERTLDSLILVAGFPFGKTVPTALDQLGVPR